MKLISLKYPMKWLILAGIIVFPILWILSYWGDWIHVIPKAIEIGVVAIWVFGCVILELYLRLQESMDVRTREMVHLLKGNLGELMSRQARGEREQKQLFQSLKHVLETQKSDPVIEKIRNQIESIEEVLKHRDEELKERDILLERLMSTLRDDLKSLQQTFHEYPRSIEAMSQTMETNHTVLSGAIRDLEGDVARTQDLINREQNSNYLESAVKGLTETIEERQTELGGALSVLRVELEKTQEKLRRIESKKAAASGYMKSSMNNLTTIIEEKHTELGGALSVLRLEIEKTQDRLKQIESTNQTSVVEFKELELMVIALENIQNHLEHLNEEQRKIEERENGIEQDVKAVLQKLRSQKTKHSRNKNL